MASHEALHLLSCPPCKLRNPLSLHTVSTGVALRHWPLMHHTAGSSGLQDNGAFMLISGRAARLEYAESRYRAPKRTEDWYCAVVRARVAPAR